MKKNVLFVIHGLDCGGAEKSLISLLQLLPRDKYNIDLLLGNRTGILVKDIPAYINVINGCHEFENYISPLGSRTKKVAGIRDALLQFKWQIQKRLYKDNNELSFGEYKWKAWGRYLPKLRKKYDLAVSYMNGAPNYYVMEKTDAPSKIIWVHNEFEKLGYNVRFERIFFEKADSIVTISESCAKSIENNYPDLKDKIKVLENISSGQVIGKLAEEKIDDQFFSYKGKKIVSVGRLMEQKNISLAIEAAAIMRDGGLDFRWYNLGEGELRAQLEKEIAAHDLQDMFFLSGLKSNPYPYIKGCDVFAQTSLYEGKSIALDEAKILQRPIVITNYTTSVNSVNNGVDGLIVDMDAQSVAEGITRVLKDDNLSSSFIHNMKPFADGNVDELARYIELFQHYLDR